MTPEMEQQRDIGKLWGAVLELRTALIGLDGENGLRGELREFMQEFKEGHREHRDLIDKVAARTEEGIAMGRQLYEVERHKPGQCIGKKALTEYVEELEAKVEERKAERRADDTLGVQLMTIQVELTKSRRAMLAAIIVAAITVAGSISSAYVTNQTVMNNTALVKQMEVKP